ncbi:MAG TPA: DUF5020 family protein [bacterium]|jgi:hypothetical protein|nr:DUF5020 family protein [bacterium]HNT66410.1 DUF5020 family protein [bacterium]HOX87638.1 DUF5020 family protein [bacterium]HPG47316.1 DUF5020 family protein [bacterium]HPM99590.1 DUF5020 family protein [bacterium]
MKFLVSFALILLFSAVAFAQNLQLHYDLGEDREYVTSTLEMFKPDEYGATFWFVDMDYDHPSHSGVSLAYWEIARYITLPFAPSLSATVQHNNGNVGGYPLGPIWLFGGSTSLLSGPTSLSMELLYRHVVGEASDGLQVTFVFFHSLLKDKLYLTGFMDIWTQDDPGKADDSQVVLLTEPQLWYSVGKHLAIGGELEISKNFIPGQDGVKIMPTIGSKWNF